MDTLSLLNGLRFVDSFFPSGGYALSSGLEAAVQDGEVRNVEDFVLYVDDLLRGNIGQRDAVVVAKAWNAHVQGAACDARDVDWELDAMAFCSETRLASLQMGRQFLRIAVDGLLGSPVLQQFHSMVTEGQAPGHFPVCMGMALASNGWKREDTVAAFLYQTTVGFVSAGMKLLPLGQRQGQRLLAQWAPWIAHVAGKTQPGQALRAWSPIQDIYAMRHSRLESRLFRS